MVFVLFFFSFNHLSLNAWQDVVKMKLFWLAAASFTKLNRIKPANLRPQWIYSAKGFFSYFKKYALIAL